MKLTNFLCLFTLSSAPFAFAKEGDASNESGAKKPNIIVILSDDISARELPIYGSTEWTNNKGETVTDPAFRAKTPALDKIAKDGLWIENCWSATICAPTRAMLMTGRYASSHKWWHNRDFGMVKNDKGREVIWPLYESSPMLIGHVAKKGGYHSMWAGKTQMWEADLTKFGFDEVVKTPHSRSPYSDFFITYKEVDGKKELINFDSMKPVKSYPQAGNYFQPNVQLVKHPYASKPNEWWPNTPESKAEYGPNTYGPDVLQKFIFDFMERKSSENQPFFVYHTANLGHDNFDYLNPESGEKWPGTPIIEWTENGYKRHNTNITGSKGNYNENGTVTEPGVHSHLEYLDFQVWRYMNKLKELKIENDTIFIFTSDNGTWGYGKGNHVKQRGTHVPFIVYAPGAKFTKKGKQRIISDLSDVLPTLADIMGVEIPSDYKLAGKSLWPYFTTDATKHREWIYSYRKDKQLARGSLVMKDGDDKWWAVNKTPENLDKFLLIVDWSSMPDSFIREREALKKVIEEQNVYHKEHGPQL